jgi:hypothetical protein
MIERPSFIPREVLLRARQADLAAYLIRRGERLIPSGANRHKHAEHDSLVFTGNAYYWNSRDEHGNAIDYLTRHCDMDFRQAVAELTGGATIAIAPPMPERGFDFAALNVSPDCRRVIDYLHRRRGISQKLVLELIAQKRLYQEADTNNALFPIYDERGAIVGAEVVGTADKRFKGLKSGGKYGYGYNVSFGAEQGEILFFESAIDLLSFAELERERAEGAMLVSLSGLKENVFETMRRVAGTAAPVLCVDNDAAGKEFIKAVAAKYPAVKTHLPDSRYKDWNEQLLASRV